MYRFFFFKQKTVYVVRISDWSSDVCSSILVMKSWIDRMNKASTTTSQANTSTRIVTALSKKVVKPSRSGSEERRVGKVCVSSGSSRWTRYHKKNKGKQRVYKMNNCVKDKQ